MKNTLFNVTFTAIFLALFSLILYSFSDTLVDAFTSQQSLYPKDKSLATNFDQKCTENIINFKDEDETKQLTVLSYKRIFDKE